MAALRLWARTMIHHQAAFSPNFPEGSFPPGEVLFHDGMGLFGLAASFMMPVDELTPFPVHVRDDPEELVLGLIEGDGLEGEIVHAGKVRLFQPFPDGYVAVGLSFLCGALVRDEANFRPFSADMSLLVEEGMPFLCFTDCFFELRRHIRAYGELDPAEAFILAPVAIRHKIMLIACRIGAETVRSSSLRAEGKGRG